MVRRSEVCIVSRVVFEPWSGSRGENNYSNIVDFFYPMHVLEELDPKHCLRLLVKRYKNYSSVPDPKHLFSGQEPYFDHGNLWIRILFLNRSQLKMYDTSVNFFRNL
jgi:hypothetical protein